MTRRTWLFGIVALAALALASCDGDAPEEPPLRDTATAVPTPTADQSIDLSGLVITMSRGGCFGFCPVYKITLRGDGSAVYEGFSNVDVKGTAHAQVEIDDVRRLVQRLEEIEFFDIPEDSDCLTSDVPRMTTTVQLRGQNHRVIHCYAQDESGPIWDLQGIEDQIDRITNSRQWTGVPEKVIVMRGVRWPALDEEGCSPWPCTTYIVVIYKDGRVEYEGLENVNVIGTRIGQVTEEDVEGLITAFVESGFFELPRDFHCQSRGFDATTTAVFLHTRSNVPATSNVVERCHVPSPESPIEPLRQLQVEIAELVGLEQWVGEELLP